MAAPCGAAPPSCALWHSLAVLHPALCSKAGSTAALTSGGLQDESGRPRCYPPMLHEGPADRTPAWARSAWAVPVPDIPILPGIPQVSPFIPTAQLCSQLLYFSALRFSLSAAAAIANIPGSAASCLKAQCNLRATPDSAALANAGSPISSMACTCTTLQPLLQSSPQSCSHGVLERSGWPQTAWLGVSR